MAERRLADLEVRYQVSPCTTGKENDSGTPAPAAFRDNPR
jgi:hypothetical protein